jgi:hypothetical protein
MTAEQTPPARGLGGRAERRGRRPAEKAVPAVARWGREEAAGGLAAQASVAAGGLAASPASTDRAAVERAAARRVPAAEHAAARSD